MEKTKVYNAFFAFVLRLAFRNSRSLRPMGNFGAKRTYTSSWDQVGCIHEG